MAIYFCVLILVCFCVLCSVFVFWLYLGLEDEADGADVDQGIENCEGSSFPKSTQKNNFLLKLERGMRDPGKAFREMSRDNVFVSAHIVYMLVYVYYNTDDDDDDVKTE